MARRRITRPSRPTNSESPQPRRRMTMRQLTEARETPQAPRDITADNRLWMEGYQSRLAQSAKPSGTPPPGGLPSDPTSPSRLQCMLLSTDDSVSATAWDSQRNALLVANGTVIDVLVQNTIYWERIQTIDVGEAVNALSTYDRRLVAASPTKVIYRDDYRDENTQATISTAGATDLLSWDRSEDTNPDWVGATYTVPDKFIIVADGTGFEIFDVGSGAPVSDNSEVLLSTTSVDYREGSVYAGTAGFGMNRYNYVTGETIPYTTISDPAIVNDNVNDVSSTILSSVDTTNLLSASEDLTDGAWSAAAGVSKDSQVQVSRPDSGTLRVQQGVFAGSAGNVVASADIELTDARYCWVAVFDTQWRYWGYDIQEGVMIGPPSGGAQPADGGFIQPLGGNKYRCSTYYTSTVDVFIGVFWSQEPTETALTQGGASGIATNLQLEQSSVPHAYVPSVTGPTTGSTPPGKQLVNRTNLLEWSNDFENAVYDKLLGGSGSAPVVTSGEIAPDGTNTAFRLQADRGGSSTSGDFSLLQQTVAATNGDFKTLSLWMKSNTGANQTVYFRSAQDDSVTVTNEWKRLDVNSEVVSAQSYLSVGARGATSQQAIDVLIWQGQLEDGTQPTAYINTEDSAATVTDDTGLFIPDWAVATDGGVSAGRDNGDVWDITGQTSVPLFVEFTADQKIFTNFLFDSEAAIYEPPTADISVSSFIRRYYPTTNTTSDLGAPRLLAIAGQTAVAAAATGDGLFWGTTAGLTQIIEDTTDYFNGAYTHVTAADPDGYNTGPMVDPNGAYANDTDTAAIGFPWDLYKDFNAPNITVFSDNFNRTDPAPWYGENGATVAIVNGELEVTNGSFGAGTVFAGNITTGWVDASVDVTFISAGGNQNTTLLASPNPDLSGSTIVDARTSVGKLEGTFQWSGPLYIGLQVSNSDVGAIRRFDNVLIQEVPALEDGQAFDAEPSIVNGELSLENTAALNGAFEWQVPTINAANYLFSAVNASPAGNIRLRVGTTSGGTDLADVSDLGAGPHTVSFVGTGSTVFARIVNQTSAQGSTREYDNVTIQQDPTGNNTLPDNSGQGNDANVIGQVTREKFNRCTYAVCCDDINYVRITGSSGDELQGWYKAPGRTNWQFFEDAGEISAIEKDGNDYLLKSGCYGYLMLSGSPVDIGEFGPGFDEGFD